MADVGRLGGGLTDREAKDSAEFKRALARHFPRLGELQAKAAAFSKALGGRKPVAPDLWLIVNGEHRFVEVKLAKDEVAPHQFAGLALLANCLPCEKPVSVMLVNLDSSADQFDEYAKRLTPSSGCTRRRRVTRAPLAGAGKPDR